MLSVHCDDIEAVLVNWIYDTSEKHVSLSDALIQTQARKLLSLLQKDQERTFYSMRFSVDKLQRFYKSHGESGEANTMVAGYHLPILRSLVQQYGGKCSTCRRVRAVLQPHPRQDHVSFSHKMKKKTQDESHFSCSY